jgi:glycerol kinase
VILTKIDPSQVSAIGITNQRETTVIWDNQSGIPIYNAVVWQYRRTSEFVESIKLDFGAMIKEKNRF